MVPPLPSPPTVIPSEPQGDDSIGQTGTGREGDDQDEKLDCPVGTTAKVVHRPHGELYLLVSSLYIN